MSVTPAKVVQSPGSAPLLNKSQIFYRKPLNCKLLSYFASIQSPGHWSKIWNLCA